MKRPAWAAAGSYAAAWGSLESRRSPDVSANLDLMLKSLAKARPLCIGAEQAEVLPAVGLGDVTHLPFDPLFLDFGRGLDLDNLGPKRGVRVVAVQIGRPIDRDPNGFLFIPFLSPWPGGPLGALGHIHVDPEGRVADIGVTRGVSPEVREQLEAQHRQAVQYAMNVLYWLESVNVEIQEAPLSSKQRKRERKKGREIGFVVAVKPPKSRSKGRGGSANYSHRFEVRGHYMHFPEGTKIADADPTKLSFVPGRGFCRKVWCPPHVKGPQDKPLVPKVRVVESAA